MSNHVHEIAHHAIHTKKHFKNSTFIGGMLPTLLATFILFIATEVVGKVEELPSWFNWVMLIVFSITITYSLVIAQRRHLVGAYGETILILIPTFVWLMGGSYEAQTILLYISVALMGVGIVLFAFAWVAKSTKNPEIGLIRVQLMIRLSFVATTVTSTIVISLIMLNWADHSVQLDEVTKIDAHTHLATTESDFVSTPWIMFIAIVTILSAVVLVMIGLTGSTSKDLKIFKMPAILKGKFNRKKIGKTTVFQINKRQLRKIERKELRESKKKFKH